MSKQFQQKTVDKYLDFLHALRLQLLARNPDFKISHLLKEWSVSSNVMAVLGSLGYTQRIARGEYNWIGDRPTEQTAQDVLTALFVEKRPAALLTGPADATPLGQEVTRLKARVDELETIVLRLMETA